MNTYLDNPVFLCGHRKGGTTALLCLFDNHPELLTYPVDSGFFYQVFPDSENIGTEEIINRVVKGPIKENLTSEMEVIDCPELFDVDAISKRYIELAHEGNASTGTHLRAMIQAYGEYCGQEAINWKAWVEKTISTEIYASEIIKWFPNAKFIHLLRDPRDNYASLKSGWTKRYRYQESDTRALLQSLLDRGGLGLRMAEINSKALGSKSYLTLKYEDLTQDPQPNIQRMTDFIGVKYHESLEKPTVNGILWPGNNFDGNKYSGLSTVNVGRWEERTETWEIAVIEAHLGDVMERNGYSLSTSSEERAIAASSFYKWFNSLPKENRGTEV